MGESKRKAVGGFFRSAKGFIVTYGFYLLAGLGAALVLLSPVLAYALRPRRRGGAADDR